MENTNDSELLKDADTYREWCIYVYVLADEKL